MGILIVIDFDGSLLVSYFLDCSSLVVDFNGNPLVSYLLDCTPLVVDFLVVDFLVVGLECCCCLTKKGLGGSSMVEHSCWNSSCFLVLEIP